jgi:hypothetical protein
MKEISDDPSDQEGQTEYRCSSEKDGEEGHPEHFLFGQPSILMASK